MRVPTPRLLFAVPCLAVLVVAMPFTSARDAADPGSFSEQQVEFFNGSVKLSATLVLPKSPGPHPAIVYLHGSGPMTREGAVSYAQRFAKLGLAGLAFDKRGSGDSTGAWVTSSLTDLARDGIAGIEYLKTRPEILDQRIGFWGVSQAGWVASKASALTDDIAFMVLISGGGASPYESEMYSYRTAFAHAGMTDEETIEALALLDKYFAYLKTGQNREATEQAIAAAETKPWYRHASVGRIMPSDSNRPNWEWVAAYDPLPDIERITCPVLLLFGDQDRQQPTDLAVKNWRAGLEAAGNKDFSIKVFPGAGHGIRQGTHGAAGHRPPFAEGYMDTMTTWLVEHVVQRKP